jgi:hypothetical protein
VDSSRCHSLPERRYEAAKQLSYFREKARRAKISFEVILIQPGASVATITDESLRLLATTELYLVKTTEAVVRFILSE